MIIAIEGLDGVGKSSVSKMLAEKLGFLYVEKPFSNVFQSNHLEKYMEIKRGLNVQQDRTLLAWFYGLNLLFGKDYYRHQNVVYDRFLVSNFSWILDKNNEFIFDAMVKALPEESRALAWDFVMLCEDMSRRALEIACTHMEITQNR